MGNTPIAATPRPSYLLQSLIMGSILHLVTPHRQAKQRPVRACHSDPHSCCDGSLLVDYYLTDDDDDGSHVDDFNRDDKGVHHNKADNPFPQSHTQYTQSQNSLWTANGTDIPSSNCVVHRQLPETEDIHLHSTDSYCPWCFDPWACNGVRAGCEFLPIPVPVVDDRLYKIIQDRYAEDAPRYPAHVSTTPLSLGHPCSCHLCREASQCCRDDQCPLQVSQPAY